MEQNIQSRQTPLPAFLPSSDMETEQRPWGSFTVLCELPGIKVKLIEVKPGHRLSLQYHHHRSEYWVCVAGRASAVIGEREIALDPLHTAVIPMGAVHRLGNPGTERVLIVEVQQGQVLDESDIVRLQDDYHRAGHKPSL